MNREWELDWTSSKVTFECDILHSGQKNEKSCRDFIAIYSVNKHNIYR